MTFDLTGLPPTPAEVEAFLADESPEAFARVVDRLLGSPRYGERWGRHWLDLARYADSNGLDENVAHGNAWRYRDYVIAAFNADKPYDRFLTEQVAGDLLPPTGDAKDDRDRLIATGFLALGPKVLAEPDETKMEMDIIDEQLDTLGRTFMGLTIGCARCHDHKFDPILASDYYGLAGIFKSTQTMDSFKTVAKWHENSIATDEDRARVDAHQKKVADRKAAIRRLVLAASPRLLDGVLPGFVLPEASDPLAPFEAPARLKKLQDELAGLEKEAVELPTAMGVAEGKVADLKIHLRGSHLTLGDPAPRRVPVVLTDSRAPAFGEGDERQARAGPLAGRPGTPADRPRDGQPDLALALRPGARAHPRQLRHPRGQAGPPRAPGLARPPLRRGRVVDQGDAPEDPALEHLPDERPRRPRRRAGRPGGAVSLAVEGEEARGRRGPRRPARRQRDARPDDGRVVAARQEPRLLLRPHLEGQDPV